MRWGGWRGALAPLLLAGLVGLISLDGAFVFDDQDAILANPVVQGEVPFGEALTRDVWGHEGRSSWRPVTLLLAWGLYATGDGSPLPFRAVSLLLHVLCVWAALRLLRVGAPLRIASLAACAFALHPLHSEVVGGLVSHADLIAAAAGFWFLAALLDERTGALGLGLATIGLLVGILAKESAVIFGGIGFVSAGPRFGWRRGALRAAPGLLVAAALTALQLSIDRGATSQVLNNLAVAAEGGSRWLLALYLFGRSVAMCLVPTGIAPTHGYAAIDLSLETLLPYAIPSAILVLLAVALTIRALARGHWWLLAMLGLLLAPALLQTNLLFLSVTNLAERLLLPATLPAALLWVLAIDRLLAMASDDAPERRPRRLIGGVAILCALLAWPTWSATRAWHSEEALWTRAQEVEPMAWRSQKNYGAVLVRAGRVEEGLWHLVVAAAMASRVPEPFDWALAEALGRQPYQQRMMEAPGAFAPDDPCTLADRIIAYAGWSPTDEAAVRGAYIQRYGCGR